MYTLNVNERSSVAIMGFNAPEWAFSYIGGIMYNCVSTGIYITNEPEACLYQINHSEAEIIVVETTEHLKKIAVNLAQMPQVKAVVVYGESKLPADL
jgi:long-chain-fatty-acid--CoA ligase ACSBG